MRFKPCGGIVLKSYRLSLVSRSQPGWWSVFFWHIISGYIMRISHKVTSLFRGDQMNSRDPTISINTPTISRIYSSTTSQGHPSTRGSGYCLQRRVFTPKASPDPPRPLLSASYLITAPTPPAGYTASPGRLGPSTVSTLCQCLPP